MRLLLAEDYPGFAENVLALLGAKGIKVTQVATNGHVAAALVEGQEWDAVLTDYDLGSGPNGGEIAQLAIGNVPLVILWSSIPRYQDELPEGVFDAEGFWLLEKSDTRVVVHLLNKLKNELVWKANAAETLERP